MPEQKVIGGPLSQDVLNQLKLRNTIMAKGDRTNEDLRYLISKAGWAKMSSGVNVRGSNALAKEYVLVAGQLNKHGSDSYTNYTQTLGYRPMPGITGVEVRSINRFGVLKEATITFNCWSVQQLTDLELLYMRPGFTVLLEWGHSIYTKDGKAPYDKYVETVANFFDDKSISKDKVYQEIEKLKKGSAYNYDAILGFVKNFSWSFRADGGYDCTTTVISIGEIIESLQILLDVSSHTSKGTTLVTSDGNTPATVLQGVLTLSKNWQEKDYWQQIVNVYPDFARRVREATLEEYPWQVISAPTVTITDGKQTDYLKDGYITLQGFCYMINALNLTDQTGQPLARFNTKIRPVDDPKTTIPSAKYKTFDYHESIDPTVCLIVSPNYSYLYTFQPTNYDVYKTAIREGTSDEILNILISIDMIQGILSEILDKPVEDRNLFLIFDSILSKINRALGEINELALHYDEATSTYYIVDRQVEIVDSDVKTLNVTGLSTTVTKFDFTTKLSPSLTTMIAISAQAGGTDVGIDAAALLRWNEGLSDRVITVKQVDGNSGGSETAEAKTARQQQERLDIYEKFLEDFYSKRVVDMQTQQKAQANYSQYAKTYINNTDYSKAKAGPAGIVPFEVGIELDGISGIKIGEAFKINEDIMPSKYNGVIGFIVTGVSHKIANNKWTTILKAQTITLKGGLSRTGNKPREKTKRGFTPTTRLRSDSKALAGAYVTSRDNNPFNIVANNNTLDYKGVTGYKIATNSGLPFLVFDTESNGVRAGVLNLSNYFVVRKLNTVTNIINTYAPPGSAGQTAENTKKYIEFVTNYLQTNWDSKTTSKSTLTFNGSSETDSNNIKMFKTLVKGIVKQEGRLTQALSSAIDTFDVKNL